MRSWMSLPLIFVVVVIIRSLPVPGSQFHNEAPAITFQPYNHLNNRKNNHKISESRKQFSEWASEWMGRVRN